MSRIFKSKSVIPLKKKTVIRSSHLDKQLAKHYRKLKEIWLHRDCALWNNHIQMNPTNGELMHVSDACSTYLDIVSRRSRAICLRFFRANDKPIEITRLILFSFRHVPHVKYLVQLLPVVIGIVKFVIIIPVSNPWV